jgi:hypothetical protein
MPVLDLRKGLREFKVIGVFIRGVSIYVLPYYFQTDILGINNTS